tara:strand:+ start:198 stop:440 length:243 start_codon:yes stop_codon:yes gene_type:complete
MVWIRLIIFLFFSFKSYSQELNLINKSYFNFIDLNNDNYISIDEIDMATHLIFQLIDSNNDDKISFDEINELNQIFESLQ